MTRLLAFSLLLTPSLVATAEPVAKLPDLPAGITSFGAAAHDDGAVYVFGGHLGTAHQYCWDDVQKPLLRLDLKTPETGWEKLPTDEPALGPALLSHSSGLIRIGGMQPRNDRDEEADMHSVPFVRRFDPETGEWSALPDLTKPRSSHDAFVVGDRIYVAGGWQMRGDEGSLWSRNVEVIDLAAENPEWRAIEAPFRRRALAVAATDNQLFVLGGLDNAGDTSLEVDVLDLETETWSQGPELPDSPIKGFGLAAMTVGEEVYVTGLTGKVHRLDRDEGAWEEVAELETGRMFPRLVPFHGEHLLVIGGGNRKGRALNLEVVELKPES